MDEDLAGVRLDTEGFARDVATMRLVLEEGLGAGADRAGRLIEAGLSRAIRNGKFGFEDLKSVALATLNDIANAAVRSGVSSLFGGGGLVSLGTAAVGALTGVPGRATGGPVSPGRAYVVGERGPELFVPTASGSVMAGGGGVRELRVSIAVNAPAASAPEALARSSRQVARAVRAALGVE
ncbi:MAG: tail tape measure protein [Sphingomonadaceae bacterium]